MTATTSVIPRSGPKSLHAAGFCIAAAALFAVVLALDHPEVAAMSLSIGFTPVAYLAVRKLQGRLDWFEVFIPFSAIYLLNFGIGAYFLLENPRYLIYQSLYDYLVPALVLSTAGYFAFLTGYLTAFPNLAASRTGRLRMRGPWFNVALVLIGLVGQGASVGMERSVIAGQGVSGVLSAPQQFAPVFLTGWFLAWYVGFSQAGEGRWRRVFPVLLIPIVLAVLYVTVGGKQYAITICGLPAIAYWYARRKLPTRFLVAVLLVAVFVVFPIYNNFRLQERRLGTDQRLERSVRVMTTHWDGEDFYNASVKAFLARLAVVTSPAAVIRSVGRWEEFRNGDTIALAVVSLAVPRVLWPDKPLIHTGKEFGRRFGLVNPVDTETQIAPTLVGELYWNFGYGGVLIGCFLAGGAFRWIYRRYGEGGVDDGVRKAIYVTLLVGALGFEGNISVLIAGAVKVGVILHAVIWVSTRFGWLEASSEADSVRSPQVAARTGVSG